MSLPVPGKHRRSRGPVAIAFVLSALCLSLAIATPLLAQEVGATLFGTVTDAGGASVPEATVTVNDSATGKTVTVTTQTNGGYSVPALTPGTYTVTVEKTGFKKSVQTGLTLLVFQKARLDIQLQVGEISTTVEVTGAAPLVESGTASVSGTVDTRQVTELPLNVRRFGSLALLFPGTRAGTRAVDLLPTSSGRLSARQPTRPMGPEVPATTS